jgi:death-on-curing protein
MEAFLMLNGYEIRASLEEAERLILGVAAGAVSRQELVEWLRAHIAAL